MNSQQQQPATMAAHSMQPHQTYAPQGVNMSIHPQSQAVTGTFASRAGFASQVGMPVAVAKPRTSTTSSRNLATGKRQPTDAESSNICCCCSRNMEYAIISFFAWFSIVELIVRGSMQVYMYTQISQYSYFSEMQGWKGVFIASMIFNNLGFWFFELPVVILNIASLCLITSRRIAPGSFQKKQFWRINLVYKANNVKMYYRFFQWFWGFIVGMVNVAMIVNGSMNGPADPKMQLMYFFFGMWPVEIGLTGLMGMSMGTMGGIGFVVFIIYMIVYCGIAFSIIKLHLSALRICKVKFEERVLNADGANKGGFSRGTTLTQQGLAAIPEGSMNHGSMAPQMVTASQVNGAGANGMMNTHVAAQYGQAMIEGNHNADCEDSMTNLITVTPADCDDEDVSASTSLAVSDRTIEDGAVDSLKASEIGGSSVSMRIQRYKKAVEENA